MLLQKEQADSRLHKEPSIHLQEAITKTETTAATVIFQKSIRSLKAKDIRKLARKVNGGDRFISIYREQ